MKNDAVVISEFEARGITDVIPRKNVLTYNKWQARGRQVRRGEKGVKIVTFRTGKNEETGKEYRFPSKCTVFHVSQTDPK